jgi:hypothetical protein
MNDDILHFTIRHPSNPEISEHIRIYEDDPHEHVEALFNMCKAWGISVRAATDSEVARVEGIEQDMESSEPDVGYTIPDDEDKVSKLVHAWANPLTLQQIYEELVIKCKNTCTNSASAYKHFSEKYEGQFNPKMLRSLLDSFNYHALREHRDELVKHF